MNSSQSRRRKARKKKIIKRNIMIIGTLLLIIVIIVLSVRSCNNSDKKNSESYLSYISSTTNTAVSSEDDISVNSSSTLSNGSGVSSDGSGNVSNNSQSSGVSLVDISGVSWNNILVNQYNILPDDFKVTTSKIDAKFTTQDRDYYFDSRAIDYLHDMCKAALADGVRLSICSAYRTVEYQQNLYNKRVQRCINEDGLSEADAKIKAATIVAIPGTSEHNLGLAIDFYPVTEQFEKTDQYKWLSAHSVEYGFIMRYPTNKKDITKIIYEPWHYRFVGVDEAQEMQRLGMCFEEYFDYLKNK